ncbi:MAG TPA: class I tRNA ligase family protein, partial [Anaerolineae bacterium]|nr:class I tRNA ligase family protein [Anaerolineae bacterium]
APAEIEHQCQLWEAQPESLSLADRWVLSRHNRLIGEVTRLIEQFQFGEAGRQLYDFLWGEYCDWYIEIAKSQLNSGDEAAAARTRAILLYVLDRTLRLLHPFMPFVTEEIWQHLPHEGDALIIAAWPLAGALDDEAEAQMGPIMEMVRAIRNARAEYEVEPSRAIAAIVVAGDKAGLVRSHADILARLARIDPAQLSIETALQLKPRQALALVVSGYEVYLPLAGLVDIDRERARLKGEVSSVGREIERCGKLLENAGFVSKAPAEVVDKERAKLEDLKLRLVKLTDRLNALQE